MTEAAHASPGRIDVQFNFSPPLHSDLVRRTRHISAHGCCITSGLAYMDGSGIAAGLPSVSTPGVVSLPSPIDAVNGEA